MLPPPRPGLLGGFYRRLRAEAPASRDWFDCEVPKGRTQAGPGWGLTGGQQEPQKGLRGAQHTPPGLGFMGDGRPQVPQQTPLRLSLAWTPLKPCGFPGTSEGSERSLGFNWHLIKATQWGRAQPGLKCGV